MPDPVVIYGQEIAAGQQATIAIPVPRLLNRSELCMSVRVVHGSKPGPRLLVTGAVHGDEVNGVEIVLQLLKKVSPKRLRGTLIAVPVVNVYGFISGTRYLPDNRDLNRCFPGSSSGSLASRLAQLFLEQVVDGSTHVIDLHTGGRHRSNLQQIRACLDNPETARLAKAFGAPVVVDAKLRPGSFRDTAHQRGIPMLVYETGEALRLDPAGVQGGVNGILAVMHELGMLARSPRLSCPRPYIAKGSAWVRAPISGVFRLHSRLGQAVRVGGVIGSITDPFGDEEVLARSARSGVIIGQSNIPLVHQGDPLVHVAHFRTPDSVVSALEDYHAQLEGDLYET